ncbi:MAG: ribose transport system substrate-binding protein [Patiriisocius sp.]
MWDEPAIAAMTALKAAGRQLPMTAVDLVNEVAIELAHGGMIKGIGAKQPYAQGEAIARACILSLLGEQVASWVVLLGIRVGPENVVESYQVVWHSVVPRGWLLARS